MVASDLKKKVQPNNTIKESPIRKKNGSKIVIFEKFYLILRVNLF